ncbi:MAG: NUDIX hydrolase [Micromonosporaceae bacterium]
MGRVDYYDDPSAPPANSLVPGVSAVVPRHGAVLMHRRRDSGLWALPGGVMEIGESVAEAVVREVREETGFDVEPGRLIGIYSDPRHVFAYDDGEVRQEFSICVEGAIRAGGLRASDESYEVAFVPLDELDDFRMHPSIRLRIEHFRQRSTPYLA